MGFHFYQNGTSSKSAQISASLIVKPCFHVIRSRCFIVSDIQIPFGSHNLYQRQDTASLEITATRHLQHLWRPQWQGKHPRPVETLSSDCTDIISVQNQATMLVGYLERYHSPPQPFRSFLMVSGVVGSDRKTHHQ